MACRFRHFYLWAGRAPRTPARDAHARRCAAAHAGAPTRGGRAPPPRPGHSRGSVSGVVARSRCAALPGVQVRAEPRQELAFDLAPVRVAPVLRALAPLLRREALPVVPYARG